MHNHSKLIKGCLRCSQHFTPQRSLSTSTLCSSPGTVMAKRQGNKQISPVLEFRLSLTGHWRDPVQPSAKVAWNINHQRKKRATFLNSAILPPSLGLFFLSKHALPMTLCLNNVFFHYLLPSICCSSLSLALAVVFILTDHFLSSFFRLYTKLLRPLPNVRWNSTTAFPVDGSAKTCLHPGVPKRAGQGDELGGSTQAVRGIGLQRNQTLCWEVGRKSRAQWPLSVQWQRCRASLQRADVGSHFRALQLMVTPALLVPDMARESSSFLLCWGSSGSSQAPTQLWDCSSLLPTRREPQLWLRGFWVRLWLRFQKGSSFPKLSTNPFHQNHTRQTQYLSLTARIKQQAQQESRLWAIPPQLLCPQLNNARANPALPDFGSTRSSAISLSPGLIYTKL